MAEAAREQALASLKGFCEREEYSDLVLTCGVDTYKLHKLVVCSRAEFFRAAVDFGGQETQTGKIDLPDDDREAVKLLVQYLYEADYEPKISTMASKKLKKLERYSYGFPHTCDTESYDKCGHSPLCLHHICGMDCSDNCVAFTCAKCATLMKNHASELLTHAQLYELADKYGVVGLKDLCQEKFKIGCLSFWNDDYFPVAANYVFSTTPENDKGLRDLVSTTISNHMVLLKKPEVEALMLESNGLAFGLLKAKAAKAKWK